MSMCVLFARLAFMVILLQNLEYAFQSVCTAIFVFLAVLCSWRENSTSRWLDGRSSIVRQL